MRARWFLGVARVEAGRRGSASCCGRRRYLDFIDTRFCSKAAAVCEIHEKLKEICDVGKASEQLQVLQVRAGEEETESSFQQKAIASLIARLQTRLVVILLMFCHSVLGPIVRFEKETQGGDALGRDTIEQLLLPTLHVLQMCERECGRTSPLSVDDYIKGLPLSPVAQDAICQNEALQQRLIPFIQNSSHAFLKK